MSDSTREMKLSQLRALPRERHFEPVTKTQISDAEEALELPLPDSLKEVLAIANGGYGPPIGGIAGVGNGCATEWGGGGTIEELYARLNSTEFDIVIADTSEGAEVAQGLNAMPRGMEMVRLEKIIFRVSWPRTFLPLGDAGDGSGFFVNVLDETVWQSFPSVPMSWKSPPRFRWPMAVVAEQLIDWMLGRELGVEHGDLL